MCCGCWQEKGAPSTMTPEILLAADFIKANEEILWSGPCHVCIEDENVDGDNLDRCRERCSESMPLTYESGESGLVWYSEKQQSTCRVAIMLLRSLEEEERVTVMGLVDGCFTPAN